MPGCYQSTLAQGTTSLVVGAKRETAPAYALVLPDRTTAKYIGQLTE
jgi:hypothetical protein